MTGTVFYECNQVRIFSVGCRLVLLEQPADCIDDPQILFFVAAADIIGFSVPSPFEDHLNGLAVVPDITAVPSITRIAVAGDKRSAEARCHYHACKFLCGLFGTAILGLIQYD